MARLSVLCALALMPAALGQSFSDPIFVSCPESEERIELTVIAKSAPASGTMPQRFDWIIKAMPSPNKVIVRCERLRQRILAALAQTEPGSGTLQVANGQRIDLYLMGEIEGFEGFGIRLPAGLVDASPQPSYVGREFKVVLCVDPPDACDLARATPKFEIATATGRSNPLPGTPAAALAGSVPVALFYSAEDLAAAKKDPSVATDEQARARVKSELLKVANAAYAKSQELGALDVNDALTISDVNDPRAQSLSTDFASGMIALYGLKGARRDVDISWGDVKSNFGCRTGCRPSEAEAPVWVFNIDNLRLVEQVNIEVVVEEWETVQDKKASIQLRQRRQKAYDRLNGPDRPSLAVRPGYLATRPDIIGDQTRQIQGDIDKLKIVVESVEKVKSGPVITPNDPIPPEGTSEGHHIIYVVKRKKKPELNLAFKAGGSYSEENSATGSLGVEEVNLLRLKETASLSAEVGGEVQKYRFSVSRPFARSEVPRLELRDFSINAQVFKDKDRRLGNLAKDEIEAREVGSSASLSFGYDSVGASDRFNENCVTDAGRPRQRTHFGFLSTISLGYRNVNIREDDKLLTITGVSRQLLPRERSQTTTVALDVNGLFRHDFRKSGASGLGVLELRLREEAQKGFKLFGSDYDYWKSSASYGGDLTFGFSSYRDLSFHYLHGHNHTSKDTPLFELPLLGGAESVRGLEEGEFLGRRVTFDQFELGLNTGWLWNLFTRKGRIKDSVFCPFEPESPQPSGPFDFKNLYFKNFFDYGRLTGSPVASGASRAMRKVEGYGVALELRDLVADESGRRVNLSIGYARSPQSRLHKSGLMFTRVTFDF